MFFCCYMCVSPSILYSLVSFPLTRSHVEELDILQRKMLRRIIGWRRIEGEAWDETMRRMRDRSDHAHQLYPWQIWSYRFFRDQWRFAVHCMKKPISRWILCYNSIPLSDVRGEYIPHRDVGRPRIKWDDHLRAFFLHYFPNRASEHWSYILVEHVGLEDAFVDFSMSR